MAHLTSDMSKPNPSIKVGDRVQLHAGTDLWAQGAKFGEVVNVDIPNQYVRVKLDKLPDRPRIVRLVDIYEVL